MVKTWWESRGVGSLIAGFVLFVCGFGLMGIVPGADKTTFAICAGLALAILL